MTCDDICIKTQRLNQECRTMIEAKLSGAIVALRLDRRQANDLIAASLPTWHRTAGIRSESFAICCNGIARREDAATVLDTHIRAWRTR
jgi:hypothetical protein